MTSAATKKILVFSRYYLPAASAGGPIKSVSNLVNALGEEFSFHIVTSDRDIGSGEKYPGISVDSWVSVGMARVMYLKKDASLPFKLMKLIRSGQFDLIYLNSFFDPLFSIAPMLINRFSGSSRSPVLLAPRGEFSSGALGLKRMKKSIYTALSKMVGLYKEVVWHASSANESNDICRVFSPDSGAITTARVISASDISSFDSSTGLKFAPGSGPESALRVCFLSRIARMKNVLFVLDLLKDVEMPLELSIYGPMEDIEYWKQCQDAIASLPANIKVEYFGLVPPSDVVKTIARHDLLVLPTLGENYGHVIVEAWAAGVPVLISDQTPWRGLVGRRLGWDYPLSDPQRFLQALRTASQWSAEDWAQVRSACLEEAGRIVNNSSVIEDNRLMLRKAIGH